MLNQIPSQIKGRATKKTRTVKSGLVNYGPNEIQYGSYASPSRFMPKNWTGTLPGTARKVTPELAEMLAQAPKAAFTRTNIEGCLALIKDKFIAELEPQIAAATQLLAGNTYQPSQAGAGKTYDETQNEQELAGWLEAAQPALHKLKAINA